MATYSNDLDLLTRAINAGVRQEIAAIAEEEIKKAQDQIAARTRNAVDAIALRLAAEYHLERNGTNIIITVKKQL